VLLPQASAEGGLAQKTRELDDAAAQRARKKAELL